MKKIFWTSFVLTIFALSSCNNSHTDKNTKPENIQPSASSYIKYKAIRYVDSFLLVNKTEMDKSEAMREKYQDLCTKQLLPLIDKKDLYSDIPFLFSSSAYSNGSTVGAFKFENSKYLVEMHCGISDEMLKSMKEGNRYFIKFRTVRFNSGVIFNGISDSGILSDGLSEKIELPVALSRLISFKEVKY